MPNSKLSKQEWQVFIQFIFNPRLTDEVKAKIFEKFHIDAVDEETGKTILITACEKADITVVKFLLKNGVDVNKHDSQGSSALFIAAHLNLTITELLIERGAEVNYIPDSQECNYSPLYGAAANGQAAIVACLLKNKANANLKGRLSQIAPLYAAAQAGHVKIIKLLLKYGAEPNILTAASETPLLTAVEGLHVEAVEVLLDEAKADPNLQDNQNRAPLYKLLAQAKQKVNPEILKIFNLLCSHKTKLDAYQYKRQTYLSIAIIEDNFSFVDGLLKFGADPRQMIYADIPITDETGCTKIVASEMTPLCFAAFNGNAKVIKRLLETTAKGDINKANNLGQTPISLASSFGHAQVVLLLSAGADPNLADHRGMTPLFLACQNLHLPVVKLLLRQEKLDVDMAAEDGTTALHKAVQKKFNEAVRLLLVSDAKVNACAKSGATPLFIAAQEGYDDLLKLLLEKGADPEIYRKDGNSPIFMAYKYGHKSCVKLLLEHFYKDFLKDKKLIEFDVLVDVMNSDSQRMISLLPVIDEPAVIAPQSFFAPKLKAPAVTKAPLSFIAEPSPKLSQTAFAFLREHGFTREQIHKMQEEPGNNKQSEIYQATASNLLPIELPENIKWFNGLINAAMFEIKAIDRAGNKSLNCYLYLDKIALREQGCDLSIMQSIPLKFCAGKHEQGIKKLKENLLKCCLMVNESEYKFEVTDELKYLANKGPASERIYCVRVLSDDGRYTLLLGILFGEKGLHKSKDIKTAAKTLKTVTLNLPQQRVKDEETVTQTNQYRK